jgi:ribonucleoside-diphosphate reductase alpha chain
MYSQKFSPGGRIWYAAGKPKPQYANCMLFDVADSREGWAKALHQNTMALTGGAGVGNEVSQVRHRGAYINGLGGTASGTLSVVSMINEVARHIMQGNTRRSACYSAVHWQHKDVWEWLTVKEWDSNIERMKELDYNYPAPLDVHNISIRYDKEFIEAYYDATHSWHSHAVTLFDKHVQQMVKFGDPSIQYDWDNQILRNACGEIISAVNADSCIIGSINLAAITSMYELAEVSELAAKFLAVVKNVNPYPTDEMTEVAHKYNRLGLGIMGMHNWLLERGEAYEWNNELESWFDVYKASASYGGYAAHKDYGFAVPIAVTAQMPTGSISRLFGGISGGIEAIFAAAYLWRYQSGDERKEQITIDPYVLQLVEEGKVNPYEPFTDALSLATPEGFKQRVEMQANIQRYTDNAISSTINLPQWGTEGNDASTLEYYKRTILEYMPKLRGITVYPAMARAGQPLTKVSLIEALESKGYSIASEYSNCSSGLCAT